MTQTSLWLKILGPCDTRWSVTSSNTYSSNTSKQNPSRVSPELPKCFGGRTGRRDQLFTYKLLFIWVVDRFWGFTNGPNSLTPSFLFDLRYSLKINVFRYGAKISLTSLIVVVVSELSKSSITKGEVGWVEWINWTFAVYLEPFTVTNNVELVYHWD